MAYDLLAKLKLIDEFSAPLRKAEDSAKRMQRTVDGTNSSVSRMSTAAHGASRAFSALGSAGRTVLSGIGSAAIGTVGAITSLKGALIAAGATYAAVINPLKLASDGEQASIAFETMLGSAEKAQKFLTDLTQFANATPFELPGLRDSAKKMLAFQFAASDVIPTLTAVGNAASGLGLGADGIDRITVALGQMKAKGRVQGDELLQLTEAGIPAMDILAKKMKVTTAEVMKMSEKGLIPADKAVSALVEGMNERFPNMMAKQSKSLAGLWSTMKDTFNNNIVKQWGVGLAATLKPRFDAIVTWINNNGATIDRWGQRLQDAATIGSDWLARKFQGAFDSLSNLFSDENFQKLSWDQKIIYAMDQAFDSLNNWLGQNSDTINKVIGSLTTIGIELGKALGKGIYEGAQQIAKTEPLLAALFAFMATPGPLPIKLAAAGVVGASGAVNNAIDNADKTANKKVEDTYDAMKRIEDKAASTPAGQPLYGNGEFVTDYKDSRPVWQKGLDDFKSNPFGLKSLGNWVDGQVSGSNAGGLSRVPYNGYVSELHRDEMVLTKSEADGYRNGNTAGGSVMVTGNTFIVRQESDIHAIARELAYEINGAVTAGG